MTGGWFNILSRRPWVIVAVACALLAGLYVRTTYVISNLVRPGGWWVKDVRPARVDLYRVVGKFTYLGEPVTLDFILSLFGRSPRA